jgi:hypothetical protein
MLTPFQAKLFESRAELELLLNLDVWDYVKPEFEKITKEGTTILLNKISSPLKVRSKGFKNPWLLMKRLQKEPILMGHDLVQAC